ncbi:hypothetical protein ES703_50507 [subsurface metagenome]
MIFLPNRQEIRIKVLIAISLKRSGAIPKEIMREKVMTERIGVRELTAKEVSSLMVAGKFNLLKPIRCKSCGHEGIF